MASQEQVFEEALPMFALRQTPSMGQGLFATRAIPRGTRIIAEPALLCVPSAAANATESHLVDSFCSAVRALSPELLAQLDALSLNPATVTATLARLIRAWQNYGIHLAPPTPALEDVAKLEFRRLAKFVTNRVQMGVDGKHGTGVFATYSRLNHSCVPNVHNSYHPIRKQMLVHAVRDIAQGEQLCVSYIGSLCRVWEQRREQLNQRNFVCKCSACEEADDGPVELGRMRLLVLDQLLAMYFQMSKQSRTAELGRHGDPEVVLEKAKELVTLLGEQGLGGVELSKAYHDCAMLCLDMGKPEDALMFARKEFYQDCICMGGDLEHLRDDPDCAENFVVGLEIMMRVKGVTVPPQQHLLST